VAGFPQNSPIRSATLEVGEPKDVQEFSASRRRERLEPLPEGLLHLLEGQGWTPISRADPAWALCSYLTYTASRSGGEERMTGISRFRKLALIASVVAVFVAGVVGISPASADHTTPHCTRGYRPCIKNLRSDVDCRGGGGNGPRYTRAGVEYSVTGSDRYGLDGDNDGVGCEQ
jgi:hypothetical protein